MAGKPRKKSTSKSAGRGHHDIAIVGMSGRFPKANDVRAYWENILRKIDAVEEVPADRFNVDRLYDANRLAPDRSYSKWGGFVDDIVFDPMKWKIPPAALRHIDPIQLMALDVAWGAMCDAGYDQREFPKDNTGVVFAIAGSHERGTEYCFRTWLHQQVPKLDYLSTEEQNTLISEFEKTLPEWSEDSFPGVLLNVLAGRIANRFDLGGPNYVVDAACASSLTALFTAIEHLRSGNADAMIVGAADGTNNPMGYVSFAKTHALSPRGRSRPFDDSADGIALGEAVAAIVVKRLDDAVRDGDRIHAIIRGIGSSSDGKNRSMTAPHPPGQLKALNRAYQDAGVSPATVGLVEAHGTGTAVGDASEITSLIELFKSETQDLHSVGVGSVKSMIGHTKTAAGLASLIKMTMALRHRLLPPTIGVEKPSNRVNWDECPLYISTETRPWFRESRDDVRRAGVSAFGFGGTNFHVVLEEYLDNVDDNSLPNMNFHSAETFFWTRPTTEDLVAAVTEVSRLLSDGPTLPIAQIAAAINNDERARTTAGTSGEPEQARLAIVASTVEDLQEKIAKAIVQLGRQGDFWIPSGIYAGTRPAATAESLCFVYPGQGSQRVNMLRDLVGMDGELIESLSQINESTKGVFAQPLTRYVYPAPTFNDELAAARREQLDDTAVAQPALAMVEMAATRWLERFGVRPGRVMGHSFGEYAGLWAAGSINTDTLVSLAVARGKASAAANELAPGKMCAVMAGSADVADVLAGLGDDVRIANENAPHQTVIGGSCDGIDAAIAALENRGIKVRPIPVSAAFHTPLLQPAADQFAATLEKTRFAKPKLAISSNSTAAEYPTGGAAIRELLRNHMVSPVRFVDQVQHAYDAGARIFVEVGPGRVLTGLINRILDDADYHALPLDSGETDCVLHAAKLLASLASLGIPVEWQKWYDGRDLVTTGLAATLAEQTERLKPKPCDWVLNTYKAEPRSASMARTKLPTTAVNGQAMTTKSVPTAETLEAKTPVGGSLPTVSGIVAPATVTTPPAPAGKLPKPAAVRSTNGSTTIPSTPVVAGPAMPATVPTTAPTAVPSATPRQLSTVQTAPGNVSVTPPHYPSSSTRKGKEEMIQLSTNGQSYNHHDTGADALLSQFQATMSQWLELQRSQQLTAERFLETQERILLAYMGNPVASEQARTNGISGPSSAPITNRIVAPTAPKAKPPVAVPPNPTVARAKAVAPSPSTPRPQAVVAPAPVMPAAPPAAPRAAQPAPAPTASRPAAAVAAPAAPAAEPTPAVAAPANDGIPSVDQFRADLLQAVSDRTGYPTEMLDETLPLESGLGIDSIKTVEIFSNLKQYHAFLQDPDADDDERLAAFTQLKTLGDIIGRYEEAMAEKMNAGGNSSQSAGAIAQVAAPGSDVERLAVEVVGASGDGEKKKN